jgi:hypothetical protein
MFFQSIVCFSHWQLMFLDFFVRTVSMDNNGGSYKMFTSLDNHACNGTNDTYMLVEVAYPTAITDIPHVFTCCAHAKAIQLA